MSADLDREIDRAVRSLLDAEPAAAFRARVVAAIGTEGPRPRWRPWALPLASAAVALLLVSVFTLPGRRSAPAVIAGHDVRLPLLAAQVVERPSAIVMPPPMQPRARAAQPRALVHATSLEEPAETGIDALAAPAPLSVGTIPAPASTAMPSIQPAPLRVTPLDLPALELPRDAARGEDR